MMIEATTALPEMNRIWIVSFCSCFVSGVTVSSWCWSMFEMWPTSVAIPVEVTTNRPEPRVTFVFMKTMSVRSPSGVSGLSSVSTDFATGRLSPVSADSAISSVAASSSRPSAGTMSPAAAPEGRHAFYFSQLAVLGRRVAEMHRAFAHHTGDPGFEPEAVTSDDVAQWKASVVSEAERTFAALASAKVPAEVQPAVDELLAARESLLERISALGIDATGLFKTRYHGDLHLGQVLLAQNDFIIIDFEGEPARPIDERRRKHSPLRDVAGMLRSFNYASHSALRAASTGVTDARATLAAAIETWERGAVSAFLAAYTDAAQGLASVPARPADLKALTDLFVFEKALYELRYELDNRPDWIPIPVQGLLALMRP